MTTIPRELPFDSSTSRVRLHLKPGPKGTKQLLAQYGHRLLCVRYRYDAKRKKRLKTVELVVAERDWQPPRPCFPDDRIVELRIAFADVGVRKLVKQAGGTWNPERKFWRLRYDRAVALGLNSRIVDARGRAERIYMQMPGRHPDRDARITVGCRHPASDDDVAVE